MEIDVTNMTCNHCKMTIEKALKEAGVSEFTIDLERGKVSISSEELARERVVALIRDKGYDVKD